MPDMLPERGPAFESQILPRATQRPFLKDLHGGIGKIDADFPPEGMRGLLDNDTVRKGTGFVAGLLNAYDRLAGTSLEIATDRRWMTPDTLPVEVARDAFDLLLVAGLASPLAKIDKRFGAVTVRLMFGLDPTTILFRDVLLGKPVPEDTGKPWKDLLERYHIPFEQLNRLACIRGLESSLAQIGIAAAGMPRPHPRAGAVINSVQPNPARPGEAVVIRGSGLGAADATTVLMFAKNVAVTTLWTDSEIHAIAPQMQGDCCVSIVEQAVATGDSMGILLEATSALAGSLGDCFGPAGAIAGARFAKIPYGLWIPEATCQGDGRNAVWIGPPRIEMFSANDNGTGAYTWRPHRPLTLRWRVTHADSVAMSANSVAGNVPPEMTPHIPASALPAGSLNFAAIDSVIPWKSRYKLGATNRCGTSEALLDLEFASRIALVAVSGGMRAVFHAGALTSLGQLLDTEPEIYAGSGFGVLAVRTAAANFRNPSPLNDFWSGVTDPFDLFANNTTVNQLQGIDGGSYKKLIVNARRSSDVLAMGFASRAGAPLPAFNFTTFDDILLSNLISAGSSTAKDKALELAPQAVGAAFGEAAMSTFSSALPVIAIIALAVKIGIETGVAINVQNTVNTAVAVKGVRDPAPLNTAIDTLVTAAGPLKASAKVRIPLGNLESGDVAYAHEDSIIVEQPLGSMIASANSLTDILRASVATPTWLPPVKMGNFHFCDGATLDPAPISAALDAGADHVFVLQPTSRHVPPVDSFDTLGFVTIEQRAMQMRERGFAAAAIAPYERWLRRDNNGALVVGTSDVGIELIEATLDLSGLEAFAGESGLLSIWSDYGYMRAFDVLAPSLIFPQASQRTSRLSLVDSLAANSDMLTMSRYISWYSEHFMNGSMLPWVQLTPHSEIVPVSSVDSVPLMREAKRKVRDLIDARLKLVRNAFVNSQGGRFPPAAAVPPTFAAWFTTWEKHPWTWDISGPSFNPWGALNGFGDGNTVMAETPPAAIDPALFGPIP